MTYIAYVIVKSDHRKQLDEYVNPCSVAANVWMIVDNIFIRHIYAAHSIVVVIHSWWNPDMNLTTFSPNFFHVPLVFLFNLGFLLRYF